MDHGARAERDGNGFDARNVVHFDAEEAQTRARFGGGGVGISGQGQNEGDRVVRIEAGIYAPQRGEAAIMSPAPTSKTRASATSTATKTPWRPWRAPPEPVPLFLRTSCKFTREVFRAGARPKTIPANSDSTTVKSRTRESRETSLARGKAPGKVASTALVPQKASKSPNAPPKPASRTLSVRSWRMTRVWFAPRAARMANSRERPIERARRRLATFAQAISNRKPTAARRTSRNGWTLPTMSCFMETRLTPMSLSASGYAAARFCEMPSMSAFACASVTPGFRRPIAWALTSMRRSRKEGSVHWPAGV